jgi:hypothetical protein
MMRLQKYNDDTVSSTGEPFQAGRSSTPPFELMQKDKGSGPGSEPDRQPFTTIDDLSHKADELASGLRELMGQRHPLEIRRGVKKGEEVSDMADGDDSKTVKAGSKTYFFDLKKTREQKTYLVITESRLKGEGSDRERASIVVFPENAEEFSQAVAEMVGKLG